MLMYPDNDPFRPSYMPEVGAKLQSFHVEIRTRSLREYKQRIRSEFLSTAIIDQLLESKPMNGQSAREWAGQLGREYGRCEKYVLSMDKAVEVFKLVEKFPTKESLQLLEVVTLRAQRQTVNELFQYDVMRLLHRFACCEGRARGRENTCMEQVEMMREVVITESVEASPSQQERLQLARGAVRVIAQLCRKAQHIRNFAVLNHKTFVYCLKCLNVFGEEIRLEFCMFLEAATHYPFGRKGEDQYKRITNKIIKCFFHQQLNIRIDLLQDNQQNSCLRAYDSLINSVTNLIKMGDTEAVARIMAARTSQQLGVIEQLASLVSRCAYVMDFPAVAESKEEVTPLRVVGSAIQLMLQLADQLDKMHCNYNSTVLFQELYRFASLRSLPLADPTSILLRRGLYFLTSNRLYDALTEEDFHSMIFYGSDQQKNLVSLLAYYLQVQVDGHNVTELTCVIKNLFQMAPPHLIEPLVLPSGILEEMVERMLNCDYIRNAQLVNLEQSINTLLLNALEAFFVVFGQKIGQMQRVNVYKQIMMSYAERLYAKYDVNDCPWGTTQRARNLLSICQNQQCLEQL